MKTIELNDGHHIPALGFGTYTLKGSEGLKALTSAINNGYRLIDTAYNYENEGTVGQAIKKASVNRSELYITSKLPGRYHQRKNARIAIEESLYRADLTYFDLYLIHWPNPLENNYVEAWETLLTAQKDGLIKSVGVSNFLPEHIDNIYRATGIYPAVNQIELHPYFNQQDVLAYHQKHQIVIEAWSPFGRASSVLNDQTLVSLAEKYGKTVNQIILRWSIQQGIIPIPKATSDQHQKENIDIFNFSITPEDIVIINSLTKPDGRLANQDPAIYQEF